MRFLRYLAVLLAVCVGSTAMAQTKTPAQLLLEFRTCAAQGLPSGCIGPAQEQDMINTLVARTPVSLQEFYLASDGVIPAQTPSISATGLPNYDNAFTRAWAFFAANPNGQLRLPTGTFGVQHPIVVPGDGIMIFGDNSGLGGQNGTSIDCSGLLSTFTSTSQVGTTHSNYTIDGIGATTGWAVGDQITFSGSRTGAFITAVAANSVTLSRAASTSLTGTPLTITRWPDCMTVPGSGNGSFNHGFSLTDVNLFNAKGHVIHVTALAAEMFWMNRVGASCDNTGVGDGFQFDGVGSTPLHLGVLSSFSCWNGLELTATPTGTVIDYISGDNHNHSLVEIHGGVSTITIKGWKAENSLTGTMPYVFYLRDLNESYVNIGVGQFHAFGNTPPADFPNPSVIYETTTNGGSGMVEWEGIMFSAPPDYMGYYYGGNLYKPSFTVAQLNADNFAFFGPTNGYMGLASNGPWIVRGGYAGRDASSIDNNAGFGKTAHAGGGAAGATLCQGTICHFDNVATDGDSGLFSPAYPGLNNEKLVNDGAHILTMWPDQAVPDTVNGTTSFSLPPGKWAQCFCAVNHKRFCSQLN